MSRSSQPNEGTTENSTARPRVRDAHFSLGVDAAGRIHHRDLITMTVHIVDASGRDTRYVVPDGALEDYMAAVNAEFGWSEHHYGPEAVAQDLRRLAEEVDA